MAAGPDSGATQADDDEPVRGAPAALVLRHAVAGDAAVLAQVAVRAITVTAARSYTRAQIDGWASSFTAERLLAAIESTTVFVAEQGGAVAGFANLVADGGVRAELGLLYVDPLFVGRGVARSLTSAVEDEGRGRGFTELVADASLLADPALQHLGYRVLERYDKARHGEIYRNTWLIKDLA